MDVCVSQKECGSQQFLDRPKTVYKNVETWYIVATF